MIASTVSPLPEIVDLAAFNVDNRFCVSVDTPGMGDEGLTGYIINTNKHRILRPSFGGENNVAIITCLVTFVIQECW